MIHEVDANGDIISMRWWPNGQTEPIFASCREDIKRNAPRKLKGEEREAWIAQKTAELEAEQRLLDEEFEQSPAGKLVAVEEARSDDERRLWWKLLDTSPTTIQGTVSLIAYILTDRTLREGFEDNHDYGIRLASLVELSLSAIAGLPEPEPWPGYEEADRTSEAGSAPIDTR